MKPFSAQQALDLLKTASWSKILDYFKMASAAREEKCGDKIKTCSIINARCGNCTQNCAFCAQSSRSQAPIKPYPLVSAEKIFESAAHASALGVHRFGIVTSGTRIEPGKELDEICHAVSMIKEKLPILPCASLGIVSEKVLLSLKQAGLDRYHHNLEASASFFPKVCTTRAYHTQTDTVKAAKNAGLSVCSGGIFGIGESPEQRIELLETLRTLEVDSIPINFLTPIPGTPLENGCGITPIDCLKIIAAARLMMPGTGIRVCGGRERNLRDLQSMIFSAGADSFMTGGYLVTPGRSAEVDFQMIRDAGMKLSN